MKEFSEKPHTERAIPLVAIFASGAGSNALKIIEYLNKKEEMGKIVLIVCNKKMAGVLDIAKTHHIDTLLIERDTFFTSDIYIRELKERGIDFIVLAGFLWKIPSLLIQAYPNKITHLAHQCRFAVRSCVAEA